MKCAIQWINKTGSPTPDTNEAIQLVRRVAYDSTYGAAVGGVIHYEQTEWFPICAEHSKRLSDPDMKHWETSPLIGYGG